MIMYNDINKLSELLNKQINTKWKIYLEKIERTVKPFDD